MTMPSNRTTRVRRGLAILPLTFGLAFGSASCGTDEPASSEPRQNASEEQPPPETPTPEPFDECGLVTPAEVAAAEYPDQDATYAVTSRSAQPSGEGWNLLCGYAEETRFGSFNSLVEIQTGVDPSEFEKTDDDDGAYYAKGKPEPIDDLGDRAYAVTRYMQMPSNEEDRPSSDDVRVLVGSTSIMVRIGIPYEEKPAPERVIELARAAVERLPDEIVVQPELVEGPCAEIDRELAGKVLGEELTAVRGMASADGEVTCVFAGQRARLDVSTSSDPNLQFQLEDMRSWAEELPGLGDEAYVAAPPLNEALVKVGDRLIFLYATHADKQKEREPNADELALVRHVVDTVG